MGTQSRHSNLSSFENLRNGILKHMQNREFATVRPHPPSSVATSCSVADTVASIVDSATANLGFGGWEDWGEGRGCMGDTGETRWFSAAFAVSTTSTAFSVTCPPELEECTRASRISPWTCARSHQKMHFSTFILLALTGRHGNAQSRWPRNSTFEVCSCRTPFERHLRRSMNLKSERDYTLLL